jgi:hypothetical protein
MALLRSLLVDVSKVAGVAAFVAWWVAVWLGIQLSRYRHEPEMPQFRRRWEISMLIFVGLCACAAGTEFVASHLSKP